MSAVAFQQFIALGDSFTEGMCDETRSDGRYRGWADRVADTLAATPGFRYANLAVRGKLLDEVVVEQLEPVRHWVDDPPHTLISFHAGPNDVLRPGVDLESVCHRYDRAVRLARDTGATVLLFTVIPRAGGSGRTADRLASRFETFNAAVRTSAARHGCLLADQARLQPLTDRRMWHTDRLHLNSEGHRRVAAFVRITLTGSQPPATAWWAQPLPPQQPRHRAADLADDASWVVQHLLPWAVRRLRGVSSGDDVSAKDSSPHPWPVPASALYEGASPEVP